MADRMKDMSASLSLTLVGDGVQDVTISHRRHHQPLELIKKY